MPRSRATRPRVRLSGAAHALLVLGSLATVAWLIGHRSSHLALAVVLFTTVAADVLLGRAGLPRDGLQLGAPDRAVAGRPTQWSLQPMGWRRPFVVRPLLAGFAEEQLVEGPAPAILSWPAMGRGVVPFVVFDAVATGPLGLSRTGNRYVQQLARPMPIGPELVPVEERWPRPVPTGFGTVEGAPVGDELFRAIRPYRRGDDRRRVHWKATARHGQLMVRELDGTGAVLVRVVVDLAPDRGVAEWTAGLAASVVLGALRKGWLVELITTEIAAVPELVDAGRIFGRPPRVVQPQPGPPTTVVGRVRSADEAHRRLALASPGPPDVPGTGVRGGRTCVVGPTGVGWR